jgi:TRAP-type mannitol/chloroaromatic compound transport system permease small subunit
MTNEEKILQMLSDMNDRMTSMDEQMTGMNQRLTHVENEAVKINLALENNVMKELNLLADGYTMMHDKQVEMDIKYGSGNKRA